MKSRKPSKPLILKGYHPVMREKGRRPYQSAGERHFYREWPDLIHPYASAIDTELPRPPGSTHLMLRYKPKRVEPQIQPGDKKFGECSKESIVQWHERHGFVP